MKKSICNFLALFIAVSLLSTSWQNNSAYAASYSITANALISGSFISLQGTVLVSPYDGQFNNHAIGVDCGNDGTINYSGNVTTFPLIIDSGGHGQDKSFSGSWSIPNVCAIGTGGTISILVAVYHGNRNGNESAVSSVILNLVPGCTNQSAINYNSGANIDDGSCMYCGNGVVNNGEVCDDGNQVNSDGCTSECTYTCTTNTECQDELTCNGEEICNTTTHMCELGTPLDSDNDSVNDCEDICIQNAFGTENGAPSNYDQVCTSNSNTCGDTNTGVVLCDGSCSALVPMDPDVDSDNVADCIDNCPSLPNTNQLDADADQIGDVCDNPDCGNSVLEGSETCDDGNIITETCEYELMSCEVCSSTCELVAGSTSYCGDGIIDEENGEECEYDEVDEGPTLKLQVQETIIPLYCDETCKIVYLPYCGDGKVNNEGEQCDDGNENNDDACSNECIKGLGGGGGQQSSIGDGGGTSSGLPSTLLETGPEDDSGLTGIPICDESDYIAKRFKGLSSKASYIVYDVPGEYVKLLGNKLIRSSSKIISWLRGISDPEMRNHAIHKFVCNIEIMKEKRGLRHVHIGYMSGHDKLDYFLQYLQDIAILQYLK